MPDQIQELLNVYDADGLLVGSMPRGDAKTRGLAVGAVQMLVVNQHGRVLLQRRLDDKENGGLWDKSVGGHVQAGETFDQALIREGNEELFGDAQADRINLEHEPGGEGLRGTGVAARRVRLELGLRDIRFASTADRPIINVTYHAAIYLGRTSLRIEEFAPQDEELADLAYFEPAEVDHMLVAGSLAPNMGFLWFALGGVVTAEPQRHD